MIRPSTAHHENFATATDADGVVEARGLALVTRRGAAFRPSASAVGAGVDFDITRLYAVGRPIVDRRNHLTVGRQREFGPGTDVFDRDHVF